MKGNFRKSMRIGCRPLTAQIEPQPTQRTSSLGKHVDDVHGHAAGECKRKGLDRGRAGDARAVAERVRNAGAIFVGPWSPVSLGDYCAGSNHVLPTGRTARFSSALGVYDFVKRTSLLQYSREALESVAESVSVLAEKEGLAGHARSALIRRE